ALVDAEPGEEIAVEERGLGEAEFEVAELRRAREGAGDRLAAAEEVALGHRDLRGEALVGRVGAAEAERAGRLLLDLDADDGGIRVRTLAHGDAGVREIAEAPDAVLGGADLARVEGIALDDAELAPDHAVEGTGVADDVDALDEDALALLELEDDVDDAAGIVAFDPRHDVDEGVALLAGLVGHALDHPLDLAGVVDRTGPDLAQQRFE